jgi:hypothetical protein
LAVVEAGVLGDGGGGERMVAGDDDCLHAGLGERSHRLARARAEGVVEGSEADQLQALLGLPGSCRHGLGRAGGEGEDAQAFAGELVGARLRKGVRGACGDREDGFRRPLGRYLQALSVAPDAAHALALRVEGEEHHLFACPGDAVAGGGQFELERVADACVRVGRRRLAGERELEQLAARPLDAGEFESVLGQRARLVGDHIGDRAQRLRGGQVADQGALAGEPVAADGEQDADQDGQLLGDGGESERQPGQQSV